jgi:KUP system potassium uptake protein
VFLAVTGGEALYADMGHFGKTPIRIAWFALVLPALVSELLRAGSAAADSTAKPPSSRFFCSRREWALFPLVGIATAAAIIASQALISGAFSLTQQAIQLGYAPRLDIEHTSSHEMGQVYVPQVNLALMDSTVLIVIGFGRRARSRRRMESRSR